VLLATVLLATALLATALLATRRLGRMMRAEAGSHCREC